MLATMKLEIPSITHKFVVCGHSQNEGDAMHACIEKQKKKVLKSGPIYVPDQWIPVISMARKSEAYFVNQMTTDDMIDFKKLSGEIGSNFNVNTDNKKVLWGKIKIIEVRKESPFKIFYKEELSENTFKVIDVRKQKLRGRRPTVNPTDLSLNLAYSRPPGVTMQKKKDLLSLCEANVIPNIYQEFYRNLSTNLTADSDDE